MMLALAHEPRKKLRYALSFLRKRLIHVNLQILYTCNFHCRICDFWQPAYAKRRWLSVGDVEIISEKLNQIGPQIVSLGGGEPLLHPDLERMVRILAPHHFPVMITNGWFLTPEIARALFAAGMVEISVSVDYADSQRHDAQRGMAGAFARAIEALRTLQANRTHPEQRVNLISVIMEDNLPDVGPLIQLCEKIGITYLVTLYSHNRGRKPAKSIPADASQKLLQLKRNHRSFVALCGYLERFTEAMDRGGIGPCYGGRNFCNIDSQGNVTFCIDRLGDSAGNILTDDMAAIEAKLMEQFRKNDCRDCWTSCRGCIETLMYGRQPIRNLLDYYCMTRPVALAC